MATSHVCSCNYTGLSLWRTHSEEAKARLTAGSQNPLSHLYVCVYVCKSQYISSRSLLTACQSALSPSFTSFVSLLLDLDPHIHPSLARPVPALLHHPDCSTFFIINSKITLIYCCPRGRIQANIEQTPSTILSNRIHPSPPTSEFILKYHYLFITDYR